MKSKSVTLLKYVIGWPLSLLSLFFIIKLLLPQLSDMPSKIIHSNLLLLTFGILSFLVYFFLRAALWFLIQKAQGERVEIRNSFYLWAMSELKRYIPGNIWSYVGRTVTFSEKGVKKEKTLHTLILEAQLIVLGPLLVSALACGFYVSSFHSFVPFSHQVIFLIYVLLTCVTLLYIYQQFFIQKLAIKQLKIVRYLASPFSPRENGIHSLTSITSFLFFGLGYYFCLMAISFVSPQHMFTLVGMFVFAYLIGFLSFITPTGAGVREGLITAGLSRFIAVDAAALVSLFARIILILSELLFVLLMVGIMRVNDLVYKRVKIFLQTHAYEIILACMVIVYCFYFSAASFLRYDNFYAGRFDLGNMTQTVWNTAHGRIFQLTDPNGTNNVSRLATHADFILILLVPFYFLWPSPKVLLLVQTVVMAGGAWYVYLLAKEILKNKGIAIVFAFLYLINPSLQRANLYDFHPVTLATPCLLGAFYYLRDRKYALFALFSILAALTKEQVWLIIGIFGLYMAAVQKKILQGIALFLVGFGITYYLISYAIPHVLGSEHFALSYYSDFGDKPSSVIKTILLDPGKTIGTILHPDRFTYLKQILFPLGFLPILSFPFLIFAGPDLLINLLSNNPPLHQIYYQYTSTITPFLFIAAIYAVWLIQRYRATISPAIIASFLLFFGIVGAYNFGPMPGSYDANLDMFSKPIEEEKTINSFLASIPRQYSVAASNNVGSHLSQRQYIYTLPLGIDKADYIAILTDTTTPQQIAGQKKLAMRLKNDPNYVLLMEKGDFVVFRKRNIRRSTSQAPRLFRLN